MQQTETPPVLRLLVFAGHQCNPMNILPGSLKQHEEFNRFLLPVLTEGLWARQQINGRSIYQASAHETAAPPPWLGPWLRCEGIFIRRPPSLAHTPSHRPFAVSIYAVKPSQSCSLEMSNWEVIKPLQIQRGSESSGSLYRSPGVLCGAVRFTYWSFHLAFPASPLQRAKPLHGLITRVPITP